MSIAKAFQALAALSVVAIGAQSSLAHAATAIQCDVAITQFGPNDFPCKNSAGTQSALGRAADSSGNGTRYSHAVKFLAGIGTSRNAQTALLDSNGKRTLQKSDGLPCLTARDTVIDNNYGTTKVCTVLTPFSAATLRIAVH